MVFQVQRIRSSLAVNRDFAGSGGTRVMSGAGFSPRNLNGLLGWWDASVTASLSLSGSTILTIADQSGGGNTMGQFSANAEPIYNATGLNSRPSMMFTASLGHALESSGLFNLGTGNTLTLFAVAFMNSAAQSFARLISYTAGGQSHDYDNAGSFTLTRSSTSNAMVLSRASGATGAAAVSLSTPFRIIVTITSGGVTTIYINGVSAASGTIAGNFISGGRLNFGVGHLDAGTWDGAISEIGVATGFTGSVDVASLDSYLQNKWGL